MWVISSLGVVLHSKNSVRNFTPCVIFGPLIISRHVVRETQILSELSLCIFRYANHYKNNQNGQKKSQLEPSEDKFPLMVIFWMHDGHGHDNEDTDIEHGLKCLW